MLNVSWIRRRWLDLRQGHSLYLIFTVQFIQFIVVTYGLYIQDTAILSTIFPTIYHWVASFIILYVPAAIYIGHMHYKKQYKAETEKVVQSDPYTFKPTPGKEQLFQYPAAVLGYEISIKMMRWMNGEPVKFTPADFTRMQKMQSIAERLGNGENILDILKER